MPGTAEGIQKARAARAAKRILRESGQLPAQQGQALTQQAATIPVAGDVQSTVGTVPIVQTGKGFANRLLDQFAPSMAGIVIEIAQAKRVPASVRLAAAIKALEFAGVGPQPTNRLLPGASDPGSLTPDEMRAFLAAGAKALALRQAKATAQDAEIVNDGPATVTPDGKPVADQG